MLAGIPNLLADDVPDGPDESANVELRKWGKPRNFKKDGFEPKQHFELGEALKLMDFEAAAKISGARFTVLKGGLARLERALGQFMLDVQTGDHGYTEINPPLLVKDDAAYGTAQLPKFARLYRVPTSAWPKFKVPSRPYQTIQSIMRIMLARKIRQRFGEPGSLYEGDR